MNNEIIGQVVSIIAMILTILSFQMKTRNQIFLFQTVGTVFFLTSFFLLNSMSAVFLNVVFIIRNVLFYFKKDHKWAQNIIWLFVILVGVIVAGVLGYREPLDILPIVGSIFGSIGMFMKRENMLRIFKLGDCPCWLIYNACVPSIGGVICEVFNIISIFIGLIRYRKNGIFNH